MNSNYKEFKVKDYVFKYYYKPKQNLSDQDFQELKNKILLVNTNSGMNFNYGIFSKDSSVDYHFEKMLVCLMELNGETVGFQYLYIYDDQVPKIVHQGLIVIYKNVGVDLVYYNGIIVNILLREKIGDFHTTIMASMPRLIEHSFDVFEEVWPSPKSNLAFQPKEYKKVVEFIFNNYVNVFFPIPEEHSLDLKRFVIEFKVQEKGFETNLRKMSKAASLENNLFAMFWLDYTKNETLVPVGLFNQKAYCKNLTKIKDLVSEKDLRW